MNDQVKTCTGYGITSIAVTNREESKMNYHKIVEGQFHFSPEMIIRNEKLLAALFEDRLQVHLKAVIDEAHCVMK